MNWILCKRCPKCDASMAHGECTLCVYKEGMTIEKIKFDNGELLLDSKGCMTAIGPKAHEYLFKIAKIKDCNTTKLINIFKAINDCTLII